MLSLNASKQTKGRNLPMMRLVFLFAIFSTNALALAPSRIYFFNGFVVPVPITSELRAQYEINQHLQETSADAKLIMTHSDFWRGVCDDLTSLAEKDRPAKLIFIGHSLGVGGAVETSRCIKDKPVDLMITIDGNSLGFFQNDDLIPDNVKENFNFYQTRDLVVRGNQNNHRTGENQDGIHNVFIDVPLSLSPHIQIVDELFNRKMVLSLIDKTLGIL